MKNYAFYRGDAPVAVGTAEECSKQLGVTVNTIRWYGSPSYMNKRMKMPNRLQCVVFHYNESEDEI